MANEGILEMDIECTECGKLMAFSNAFKYEHKYLCPNCAPDLDQITSSQQIPQGAKVRPKTMYEEKLEQELADIKVKHIECVYQKVKLARRYASLKQLVWEFTEEEHWTQIVINDYVDRLKQAIKRVE